MDTKEQPTMKNLSSNIFISFSSKTVFWQKKFWMTDRSPDVAASSNRFFWCHDICATTNFCRTFFLLNPMNNFSNCHISDLHFTNKFISDLRASNWYIFLWHLPHRYIFDCHFRWLGQSSTVDSATLVDRDQSCKLFPVFLPYVMHI